ncbi:hypothetical protein ACNO5M_22675 [Vibrio owensii]|uniref:hypothetical protein n=1 Tax=Vibrio owensii TaxID=696485 RepID=UPI003AAE2657
MKKHLIVKIVGISLFFTIGLFFAPQYIELMNTTNPIIKVGGIANIAAVFAMLFWMPYLLVYWINDLVKLPFPIGEFNKTFAVLTVLSLVVSLGVYKKIQQHIVQFNYIECKDMREISSRYSSRTYAISPELCEQQ